MLFNSLEFGVFLVLVYCLYWLIAPRSRQLRNALLLVASYIFYGWWDPRFLGLLVLSSAVDFVVGVGLQHQASQRRRWLLAVSLVLNLGLLGVFKYFDFFASSLASAMASVGINASPTLLHLVLPVGISFYTFQTLSYSIDVYRGTLQPTRDALAFFAYVAFFPQLVAGPIERAAQLLPQFLTTTQFDTAQAKDGLRQMLWGFFKKMVIADNAARFVTPMFDAPSDYPGSALFLGAIFFSFQIYGDFSGYSDIAIGCARLFGFRLSQNFHVPYFARDVPEFWRRWHVSLTSWFRDYVYFPLGGSRVSKPRALRNVLIVFLVSGLWHGANWTFVIWGALHAACFVPFFLFDSHRRHTDAIAAGRTWPLPREMLRITGTFLLVSLAWVFFRARSVADALHYLGRTFSSTLLHKPGTLTQGFEWATYLTLVGVMLALEWRGRDDPHALHRVPNSLALRWCGYQALLLLIAYFGVFDEQQFIYFQF